MSLDTLWSLELPFHNNRPAPPRVLHSSHITIQESQCKSSSISGRGLYFTCCIPVTRSNTFVYLWTSTRFSSMNLQCISARITAKRSWLSYTFRSLPSHETKRASRTLVTQHYSSQSLLPPVCPSNCVISHTFREYAKSMKSKEVITEGMERSA